MVTLFHQVLGYGAVGVVMSVFHAIIASGLIVLDFDVYVANLTAFSCCFPVSVLLNKRLVFHSDSVITYRAYLTVYFLTLLIASSTILVRHYIDLTLIDHRLIWVEHIVTQGIFSLSVFLLFKWFLMR